jgi:hypothetical protein
VGEGMTDPPGLRAGWPGYCSRDRRSLLISQGAGTGGAIVGVMFTLARSLDRASACSLPTRPFHLLYKSSRLGF